MGSPAHAAPACRSWNSGAAASALQFPRPSPLSAYSSPSPPASCCPVRIPLLCRPFLSVPSCLRPVQPICGLFAPICRLYPPTSACFRLPQVGCAMACSFCATGRLGLRRNLETWEIVDQVRPLCVRSVSVCYPLCACLVPALCRPCIRPSSTLRPLLSVRSASALRPLSVRRCGQSA